MQNYDPKRKNFQVVLVRKSLIQGNEDIKSPICQPQKL